MKIKLKFITYAVIVMMLLASCNNNSNENNKTKTTNGLKKKIIVIDPGHANKSNLEKEPVAPGSSEMKIKDGGGAEGIVTRMPEYKINMQVAVKLKSILESKNYTVVMTKTNDSESLGNVERAEVGNKIKADLVIRLHADSNDNTSVSGASMLIPSPINDSTRQIYESSKKYGAEILNVYCANLNVKNKGIQEHSDMTGFNWSKVPVVLIEMGFLSNSDEDKLLSDLDYENKVANALANGIDKALS